MHVTQSAHSIQLLQSFRDYFDCGVVKVDNKLTNSTKRRIRSYKDISNKIIPFLDKYPLLTSKYLNYQTFKKAIDLMNNGEHLTSEGMSKIQELAARQTSHKRSFSENFNFTKTHLTKYQITPNWIRGFVDGEGCFYFYIGKQTNTTIQLQASLEIAQNTHDILILEEIRKFLDCGRFKPKFSTEHGLEAGEKASSISRLSTSAHLKSKIIPFFDNNCLLTTKSLDYADWKKLIEMKDKKCHLTPEGLNLMKNIKSNMNTSRKDYSSYILDV